MHMHDQDISLKVYYAGFCWEKKSCSIITVICVCRDPASYFLIILLCLGTSTARQQFWLANPKHHN